MSNAARAGDGESGRVTAQALLAGMSDNNLAPLTLPAAKPYAGKAQTAAVGAAVRKMIAAGWAVAHSGRSSGRARLQVVGRGSVVFDGVRSAAATVLYYNGEGATFEQVRSALRDAGWVLFDVRDEQAAGVWSSADVAGPGVAEWRFRAAHTDDAVRRAAVAEARGLAAARLKSLAAELDVTGLVGHVSEFSDSVSVPYGRMADLLELLSAERAMRRRLTTAVSDAWHRPDCTVDPAAAKAVLAAVAEMDAR